MLIQKQPIHIRNWKKNWRSPTFTKDFLGSCSLLTKVLKKEELKIIALAVPIACLFVRLWEVRCLASLSKIAYNDSHSI